MIRFHKSPYRYRLREAGPAAVAFSSLRAAYTHGYSFDLLRHVKEYSARRMPKKPTFRSGICNIFSRLRDIGQYAEGFL